MLAALLGIVALGRSLSDLGGPAFVIDRLGPGAPFALLAFQTALATTPVPSEVIALASAAAYGWGLGALMTWVGWTLAAMIQYALARRSARRERTPTLRAIRLPAFLRRFPLDHPVLLVCVRWLPMGFHFANITAGLRRVSVRRQLWTAALGALPGAIVWAGIGAGVTLGA
jgi:uncharacterized membrane protein YdjX (TVP38/TMEM64 family)